MKSKTIITQVTKYGRIPERALNEILCYAARTIGKEISITIGQYVKQRSRAQNSFFHGAFMDAVMDMYHEVGNDYTNDEVKQQLKSRFGLKKKVTAPDGKVTEELVSTREYTTIQIEDFMTKIRAWAAPFKQLPFPNE